MRPIHLLLPLILLISGYSNTQLTKIDNGFIKNYQQLELVEYEDVQQVIAGSHEHEPE